VVSSLVIIFLLVRFIPQRKPASTKTNTTRRES
jgi:hypothetical protein